MKKIICDRIEKYFRKWFDLWEQKKIIEEILIIAISKKNKNKYNKITNKKYKFDY